MTEKEKDRNCLTYSVSEARHSTSLGRSVYLHTLLCLDVYTSVCLSVCPSVRQSVSGACRMKAYLDTSVNTKSADYDDTELIFDKNMYRTGEQVLRAKNAIIHV